MPPGGWLSGSSDVPAQLLTPAAPTTPNVLILADVWRYPVLEAGLALTIGPVVAVVVAGPTSRLVQGRGGDLFCYLAVACLPGSRPVSRYLAWGPALPEEVAGGWWRSRVARSCSGSPLTDSITCISA